MAAACSLANPSKNLTQYVSQVNRLSKNCIFTKDTKAGPSLTVNEEFLASGKKPPASLHCKVTVDPDRGFTETSLTSQASEILNSLIYPDDDPVVQGYVKKYNLTDSRTFIICYDLSSVNILMNLIAVALDSISAISDADSRINIVILLTGAIGRGAEIPNFNILTEALNVNVNVKVTPVLEWELAIKLATLSTNHILINNTVGLLGAVACSLDNRSVWSAAPNLKIQPVAQPKWLQIMLPECYKPMFDCLYYINMDKRTDRREHMDKQLAKFNICATRIAGVDGSELPWHPNLGPVSTYWNHGALGYCLSYRNVIIDAIKHNYQRILIMDDDAVLTDNFLEILEKAYNSLPTDWHILYLAANHSKESMPTEKERVTENLYRLKGGSVGSHALILNRPSFDTIMNFASRPYGPMDLYLSMYQKVCPCYISYPGLATQLPGRSDILNKDIDYSKEWGLDYINHISYLKNEAKA
jgi:GR25 family glycosyltransferase involved in LPS biosynthesis